MRWLTRYLRRGRSSGFTLLEMVIYLIFSGIVVGAMVSVIVTQQRDHHRQRESARVRQNLATAGAMITSELRPLAPGDGDLYVMTEDSVAFRGVVGSGIQCETDGADPATYTITNAQGDFSASRSDSLLMFVINGSDTSDDVWRPMALQSVSTTGGTSYKCAWDTSWSGPHRVTVVGDTTGIRVGGPVVAYERVVWALRPSGSDYYLQRRAGSGSWESVVGPLLSPGQNGLRLQYLDVAGNTTATPADVRSISVELRGEREDPWGSTKTDSLKTIVHLRGG